MFKELFEAAATIEILKILFVGTWQPGAKPRGLLIATDFEIHWYLVAILALHRRAEGDN